MRGVSLLCVDPFCVAGLPWLTTLRLVDRAGSCIFDASLGSPGVWLPGTGVARADEGTGVSGCILSAGILELFLRPPPFWLQLEFSPFIFLKNNKIQIYFIPIQVYPILICRHSVGYQTSHPEFPIPIHQCICIFLFLKSCKILNTN